MAYVNKPYVQQQAYVNNIITYIFYLTILNYRLTANNYIILKIQRTRREQGGKWQ